MYPSCRDIVVQRWRNQKLLESDEYAKEPISLFKDGFFFCIEVYLYYLVLNNYTLVKGKAKVPA